MIRFFTFSAFHNKIPPTGSTQIRVNQLIKYWPESGLYKYGENPDVLIFQKVYASPDYKFPIHFENLKILDICDADWLTGLTSIVETAKAMDAVTCPTESIAKFMEQMVDCPVVVIKDRFDLEPIPEPKQHTAKAKSVVWFGYKHNIETLRPAIRLIDELGLKLTIISDDDPSAYRWGTEDMKMRYKFVKYNEDTIYHDLQKADFAVIPKGFRPQDYFKSENRTIKANLAGLPVGIDSETVKLYMNPVARQEWQDTNYGKIRTEYDVNKSVNEYKQLIQQLSENRA